MHSTIRFIQFKSSQEGRYDLSPFRVRTDGDAELPDIKKVKKEVTILAPQDMTDCQASCRRLRCRRRRRIHNVGSVHGCCARHQGLASTVPRQGRSA